MTMNLKASFVDYLVQKYPELNREQITPLISDNLLSPFQVHLSAETIESIRSEIKKYWKLRNYSSVNLKTKFDKYELRQPSNFGVCMSYDFHISSENKLELIEINTNASFLAMGLEVYQFLGLPEVASGFNQQKMTEMFLSENNLNQKNEFKLVIADEEPEKQRLFIEFLIYQAVLKKNNLNCEIADIHEIQKIKNSSLVYNRYTDFYLQEEKSDTLKKLFNQSEIELSPNPYEYFLMADKERLIDWFQQNEIEKPISLLPSYDLGVEDKEKIWTERKNLFFKPKNAYGSKQAYKGSSISRKVFEEVTHSNFIAQQISLAPEIEVEHNNQKIKLRYDLRCYAYQDELQLIIARLYQGQTTNLRTEGGGFACVVQTN